MTTIKVNDLAMVLWSLTRMKGQLDTNFMMSALRHCFSAARQLTPAGITMVVWALSNLTWTPPKAWVDKALLVTHVRMHWFDAKELSMLITSLARLEYKPPASWLEGFTAAALKHMMSFGPQVSYIQWSQSHCCI